MKFVFFGTRELAAKVLERLLQAGYSPAFVVTGPDRPAGRKQKLTASPVKEVALHHNLPLAQPEDPKELLSRSELKEAEFFVVAAYGNILPKELIELPPKGVLNVHPSLLPLYRGPAPERGVLLSGDKKTGVTVILVDEKVDHGPIVAKEEFSIPEDMRHEELHLKLGEIGGQLLVKTIPLWLQGKITPKEQDHSKATFTKKAKKEDGRIDWSKEAQYITRQIRAFYPWPGTYTLWQEKLVKVLQAKAIDTPEEYQEAKSGTVFSFQKQFAVVTGKQSLLVEQLQLAAGNPMPSQDFLLGHKDFLGTILK
tara:strand:+ start:3046 stop:3975 length:930 start_codon:yes stop_codon:yes gene_type:complete